MRNTGETNIDTTYERHKAFRIYESMDDVEISLSTNHIISGVLIHEEDKYVSYICVKYISYTIKLNEVSWEGNCWRVCNVHVKCSN